MTKFNYNVKTTLSTFNRFAPLLDDPTPSTEASTMVCCGKSLPMDLPREIVADVLSRIPIKTIARLNCVCKSWRSILSEEPYFANLRLSSWPACLITFKHTTAEYGIFKVAEADEKSDHHGIYHEHLMNFDSGLGPTYFNPSWLLCGSVNGLICLRNYNDAACICNPITREYILLPDRKYIRKPHTLPTYGFGFVKASNEYKVVRFYERDFPSTEGLDKSWCEVYTLGIGMWRSLGQVPFLADCIHSDRPPLLVSGHLMWCGSTDGIFLGGNLHWLVYDQKDTKHERVCTFDMMKEVFQLTASPQPGEMVDSRRLGVLGECLCVCDTTRGSELAIWVMKDYGMKESWSKEIVIRDDPDLLCGMVHPLKVFKDGTVLLLSFWHSLFTYDTGTKTFQKLDIFQGWNFFSLRTAMVFVPSSIRLKSFMLEKVSVF